MFFKSLLDKRNKSWCILVGWTRRVITITKFNALQNSTNFLPYSIFGEYINYTYVVPERDIRLMYLIIHMQLLDFYFESNTSIFWLHTWHELHRWYGFRLPSLARVVGFLLNNMKNPDKHLVQEHFGFHVHLQIHHFWAHIPQWYWPYRQARM